MCAVWFGMALGRVCGAPEWKNYRWAGMACGACLIATGLTRAIRYESMPPAVLSVGIGVVGMAVQQIKPKWPLALVGLLYLYWMAMRGY